MGYTLAGLNAAFKAARDEFGRRLKNVEQGGQGVVGRVTALENQATQLRNRLTTDETTLQNRCAAIETRCTTLETRCTAIETELDKLAPGWRVGP